MAESRKLQKKIIIDLTPEEDTVMDYFIIMRGSTWLNTFVNSWMATRIQVFNEEKGKVATDKIKKLTPEQKQKIKVDYDIDLTDIINGN